MTAPSAKATLTIRRSGKGKLSYGVYIRAMKKVVWCKDREAAFEKLKKLNTVKE